MNNTYNYQPSNYNRLFNNKEFVSNLLKAIMVKLGRGLQKVEQAYIINFLKDIEPSFFNGKTTNVIIETIALQTVEDIKSNRCGTAEDTIDIHEMLKNVMNDAKAPRASDTNAFSIDVVSALTAQVSVNSIMGINTKEGLQSLITPANAHHYAYLLFDTRYRTLNYDGINAFRWNFVNSESTTQGSVNAIGNIQNIVGIRMFPFRMPYVSGAENNYNRITLFIQEFHGQAFIARETVRFHFMFKPHVNNRWIELVPDDFYDGHFRFAQPITTLDTLTFSFGSPLDTISFDLDYTTGQVSSYGTTTNIVTPGPHNLENGDLVYISGFTTYNPVRDLAPIAAMNVDVGLTITYIDTTHFSVAVDTSQLTSEIVVGAGTVDVTYASDSIVGTGSNFTTLFIVGDAIVVNGVGYIIVSILSDTLLKIDKSTPPYLGYSGTTLTGQAYSRNNIIPGETFTLYFGAKRMFIPMEFEYIAATV